MKKYTFLDVSRCKEGDNKNYYWKLKIEFLEENSGFILAVLWRL
jgi:hypothetical protein